jgi:hypothetical protein
MDPRALQLTISQETSPARMLCFFPLFICCTYFFFYVYLSMLARYVLIHMLCYQSMKSMWCISCPGMPAVQLQWSLNSIPTPRQRCANYKKSVQTTFPFSFSQYIQILMSILIFTGPTYLPVNNGLHMTKRNKKP